MKEYQYQLRGYQKEHHIEVARHHVSIPNTTDTTSIVLYNLSIVKYF